MNLIQFVFSLLKYMDNAKLHMGYDRFNLLKYKAG